MPTIDVSYHDLCTLIGKKVSLKELREELILYVKGEVDAAEGDTLKIDIKDTNRPDLWSAEGIAREIRNRIKGSKGVQTYAAQKSDITVRITTRSRVQPLAVCAVAEKLAIDGHFLSQILQLQEKIASSFGRKRRELSMGIYDMSRIKLPVVYTSRKPEDILFVPLGFSKEMTAEEILQHHPKGREYGHLLRGEKEYPVWVDATGKILSMPPIINSESLGNVSAKTTHAFIEVTGHRLGFLSTAINVLAAQMLERGAAVKSVKTVWNKGSVVTPDFSKKTIEVSLDSIRKISGLGLDNKNLLGLLRQAGYEVVAGKGSRLTLNYPSYRQDVMHWRDVAEDVAVSYGYNHIEPRIPRLPTSGKLLEKELFSEKMTEIMIGMGFQEILSYTLTNKNNLFSKMNMEEEKVAEIENPSSANWGVFRTWLMPNLMEFFSQNKHIDYPQSIFEIGDVVLLDEKMETKTRDRRKVAAAISDAAINYDRISSALDALMRNLAITYKLARTNHASFIHGRVAGIIAAGKSIGIVGEISPHVLNNWGLEKPAVAFELDADALFSVRK
ncbi:MAG: phenylalanine--tRNA ligase subunit beta [Candidatus Aenigmarchaeota archaeon]|nr:phenylalanine--tRNA ligase subunit beta [Candidatus Aenigmarchaeota archaeon]